jgi:1-acyl-sn-glycerol-3-phosphate acyltransferase
MNKTFDQRYRLQRFGTGFVRLALGTKTPIVPVGIVGSEEQQPGLLNLERLGRILGMPAFPVTPTFPWLGPLGLLPLPVRYRIHFGEPLRFTGDAGDEDAVIEGKVEEVKAAISALLAEGRVARKSVFF